ncbi:MAG: PHP domain-containing protein [Chloroflexota bacterium]
MLKADLHIHSEYSMDCDVPLEKIIARCLELGINCIAISDHGTAEGALKMQSIAPFLVIVAEEILTPQGEIMGMFLKETIPSNQPLPDVIASIRAQGGLVCAQHPFDTIIRPGLGQKAVEEIAGQLDLVEVFNARSTLAQSSKKALRFAQKHHLPGSAGSDAHTLGEIGNACIEMPEFTDQKSFLEALSQGRVCGHLTGPFIHLNSVAKILKRKR